MMMVTALYEPWRDIAERRRLWPGPNCHHKTLEQRILFYFYLFSRQKVTENLPSSPTAMTVL
jgi:hypothetical protein